MAQSFIKSDEPSAFHMITTKESGDQLKLTQLFKKEVLKKEEINLRI